MAFPTQGILDAFNRADEGPPPSASWRSDGIFTSSSALKVVSNGMMTNFPLNGGGWGASIGPDCENYVTIATLFPNATDLTLYLRIVTPGSAAASGYLCIFTRKDANPGYSARIFRLDSGATTQLGSTVNVTSGAMANGDKIGFEAIGSTLTMYYNTGGVWTSQNSNSGDVTYTAAGFLYLKFPDEVTGVADDFGGGTIGGATVTPPLPMIVDFAVTRAASY